MRLARQSFVLPGAPRTTLSPAVAVQMNFFDDMQAQFQSMFKAPVTIEEAELYCRDDESSGCTVEMMDLLKAQEGSAKAPISKPRWSAEIDDAVVKPE